MRDLAAKMAELKFEAPLAQFEESDEWGSTEFQSYKTNDNITNLNKKVKDLNQVRVQLKGRSPLSEKFLIVCRHNCFVNLVDNYKLVANLQNCYQTNLSVSIKIIIWNNSCYLNNPKLCNKSPGPERLQWGFNQQLQHHWPNPAEKRTKQLEPANHHHFRRQLHRNLFRLLGGSGEHLRRENHQMFWQLRGIGGKTGTCAGPEPGGDYERVSVSNFFLSYATLPVYKEITKDGETHTYWDVGWPPCVYSIFMEKWLHFHAASV